MALSVLNMIALGRIFLLVFVSVLLCVSMLLYVLNIF